jgi:hypothetical protein
MSPLVLVLLLVFWIGGGLIVALVLCRLIRRRNGQPTHNLTPPADVEPARDRS